MQQTKKPRPRNHRRQFLEKNADMLQIIAQDYGSGYASIAFCVLRSTVDDLKKENAKKFDFARAYIGSAEFENYCDLLNLDPDYMREQCARIIAARNERTNA